MTKEKISHWLMAPRITMNQLIVLVALFFMLFMNRSFYQHLTETYPPSDGNTLFLTTVVLGFMGFIIVLLGILCHRYTIKPIAITLLLIASVTSYFMDSYNAVIDYSMLQNTAETDLREVRDLMSWPLVLSFVLLGLLPSAWIARATIVKRTVKQEYVARLSLLGVTLAIMATMALSFSDYYSTFFREHKIIRYYFNPGGFLYAGYKYVKNTLSTSQSAVIESAAADTIIPWPQMHRELVIMVVGETARADRFSLNGYERETNPLLKQQGVISYTNFWSCGTSTAISVPCMFSIDGEDTFDVEKAAHKENALDVLARAGTNILWRDNNSSSKRVADRVEYQDFRSADVNPVCDHGECRDIGMLTGLDEYIASHPYGDILIVLHQMGNHGPAYYKRYPEEFERFTPACHTNELKDCTQEEISNAYDNVVLYTDYFLSEVINFLKPYDGGFETAMFYVSDHGESLGENGLYLHGMPKLFAPEAQTHVPAILWIGEHYDELSREAIMTRRHQRYTHDSIFHTLLSFMEAESEVYDLSMDLLHDGKS